MHDITLIWQYESPFERDWIRFLLGGFFVHEVTDCSYRLVAENSVVIMSSRRHVPHSYITKLMQTRRCVLYHISDESFHGRYEDYVAFDFVFRNFGSAVFETDGIKVLPLGYTAGMRVEGARRRATERRYIWCFVGALKASRAEALRALTGAYQGFVHIGGSGGTRRIDRPSYRQILEDSVFCPCPMGNVNLETARFYDALEAGCIPIVETRPTMRCYETLFRELPVPKVRSWREASQLIGGLLRDPGALDAKQREIGDWWQARKRQLQAEVTQIVEECFFSGKEARKLSKATKPLVRVPGWRHLELLRHHSPAAALRRAKLELSRRLRGTW